jgi:hypothetical protein
MEHHMTKPTCCLHERLADFEPSFSSLVEELLVRRLFELSSHQLRIVHFGLVGTSVCDAELQDQLGYSFSALAELASSGATDITVSVEDHDLLTELIVVHRSAAKVTILLIKK